MFTRLSPQRARLPGRGELMCSPDSLHGEQSRGELICSPDPLHGEQDRPVVVSSCVHQTLSTESKASQLMFSPKLVFLQRAEFTGRGEQKKGESMLLDV